MASFHTKKDFYLCMLVPAEFAFRLKIFVLYIAKVLTFSPLTNRLKSKLRICIFLNVFSLAQSIPPDALPQKHRIQFQKRLWIAMRNKRSQAGTCKHAQAFL